MQDIAETVNLRKTKEKERSKVDSQGRIYCDRGKTNKLVWRQEHLGGKIQRTGTIASIHSLMYRNSKPKI